MTEMAIALPFAGILTVVSGVLGAQLSKTRGRQRAALAELSGRRQEITTLTGEWAKLRDQVASLQAQLNTSADRAAALESRAVLAERTKGELQERLTPIVDVHLEAERLRAALGEKRRLLEAELEQAHGVALEEQKRLRDQVAAAQAQVSQELAAHRQQLAGYLETERDRLARQLQTLRADGDAQARTIAAGVATARSNASRDVAAAQAEAQRIVAGARGQAETELFALQREAQRVGKTVRELSDQALKLRTIVDGLDEMATLQSFGYYEKRYQFGTSAHYERLLEQVCSEQKAMLKAKTAAVGLVAWQVNGSVTEGRKQINQTLRLMLRAFNGEADAAIAKVSYKNFAVMEKRIQKAYETINSLAEVQQCTLASAFVDLRLQELVLVHEHMEKLHQEREEQRKIRERMRDEEIAQRQIEKARQEAEDDERQYETALEKARREVELAHGRKQEQLAAKVTELQRRLEEAQANKARAVARAQLTRSGHIYVISNLGSFGEHVYKIGMTRRLDPLERIRELGDASVPFEFDVHAIIFAEDAPTLEAELHRAFAHRRVNRVNERKEFFKVRIADIAAEVRKHRAEIIITEAAEAEDYRKTLAALAELERSGAAGS